MSALVRIALVVDSSRAYGRGVCQGVAQFVEEQGNWLLFRRDIRVDPGKISSWLSSNRIDGIITYIPHQQLFTSLRSAGLPMVDVLGQGGHPGVTTFDTDPVGVARLAADFFLQAGLGNFAFCGYPGVFFSDRREKAFRDILWSRQKAIYAQPPSGRFTGDDYVRCEQEGEEMDRQLCEWLRKLPKPIGILACNDVRGQQVISACREMQIETPSEVAVIGVDNDDIVCTICQPTLSSIAPDTSGIGYSAARELAGLLEGGAGTGTFQSLPPLCVVERQSTNITRTEHPLVAQALRLIQEKVCQNINAKDLCGMLGCLRQTLDNLFVRQLGRTAADEICQVRLKRVTGMLRETSLGLVEIAERCGFPSTPHLCRFVRRETGMTPLGLRRISASVALLEKREGKAKKPRKKREPVSPPQKA